MGPGYADFHSTAEISSESTYSKEVVPITLLELFLLTSRTYYIASERTAALILETS